VIEQGKSPQDVASLRHLGYVLVTLGAIVLPLCGLCTGAFLVNGWRYPSAVVLALIVGGVPIAGAVFALWWGVSLLRTNPKTPRPPREGEP
jgi:hypothetical protein